MTYTKPWEQGALKVTENGRYFSCGDTPFFWMGDTAWLLFHRLTEEETRNYLRNRKELGYNIILADFLHSPEQENCAGDAALVNGDFNSGGTGTLYGDPACLGKQHRRRGQPE